MYIVIMAGGQGTRLWPMSRQNKPKQLFELVTKNTLLQDTINRLTPKFDLKKIFIATNKKYVSVIHKLLPNFPKQNIIAEPSLRDTSACIGLATAKIYHQDPNAIIAVLPSDHFIEKEKLFLKILSQAGKLCEREQKIVILGINPTRPATELGYINIDKTYKSINGYKVFHVKQFIEKPDYLTAKKYLKSWKYFWNAGMFIYPAKVMLDAFAQLMPQNFDITDKIIKSIGTKNEQKTINKLYDKYEKKSIDYGIMEKSHELLMIPADIGWSDIGTWGALKDVLSNDDNENVTKGKLFSINTTGSLIYTHKKPIVTLGVKNMIVVDTDDIMLICSKNESQNIKSIVEMLKESDNNQFL